MGKLKYLKYPLYPFWPPWHIRQFKKASKLFERNPLAIEEKTFLETEQKTQEEQKDKDKEEWIEPKIYPARDLVMITTGTNIYIKPCDVKDDHKLEYSNINNKKKVASINTKKPSGDTLSLPLAQIYPTRLMRLIAPRVQRFRLFTIQSEGEMTHDPHDDMLDEEDKMKLESILKIQATAAKVAWHDKFMQGMREALGFWMYFRDVLYITVIVLLIFAFQIQPNL